MGVDSSTKFGDLQRLGMEVEVICQKCGSKQLVDGQADPLRDRCVVGARYRCACGGIGLPAIGKERRWVRQLADLSRRRNGR